MNIDKALSMFTVQCSLTKQASYGDDRVRTDGLRSASAALSQLSYIPLLQSPLTMGLGRVELPTSRLSGVRSNHLSYRPGGVPGIKPKNFFGVGEPADASRRKYKNMMPDGGPDAKDLRQKTHSRKNFESSEE